MNDITNRFLEVYEYLLTQKKIKSNSEFAKKLDISTSLMTEILKKRSNAGINPVQNIVKSFTEISAEWLLTGQGNMLKNEVQKEVSAPITGQNVGVLEQENAFLKRENELLQGQIKDKNKIITTLESNQKLLQEKISAYEKSTHYATASQSITRPTL